MTLLMRDATVVTMDAAGTIHAPGAVRVDGARIADVGPSDEVASRAPDGCEVIEAAGRIALPGFVSAHNHLGYTVFRGRAEDVGHSPTHRLYLPMSMVMRREEREALGSLAVAELLRGGVTTVFEMEEDADALAPFIARAGVRAAVGLMAHDVDLDRLMAGETVFDARVRRAQVERAVRFAEDWHGAAGGRIGAVITANGLSTSSPELLRSLRAAADRLGLRLSIHLASGEMHLVRRVHGQGSFEYAAANGFLGEDVIAVHCYRIDARGIDAMVESGTHLAHCPLMNQFRGGIAPVGAMRARGVNVGLGIDNYFSDFFDVIRSCIAVARIDEIERLRTEFLGLVSHELREPLAAIKGSAATLLEEAPTLDPAEMREFHRLIGEQADHMRGLIGDLLDAGRIEAGTLSVSPEPSDAAGLVERARATFLGGGARHGVVVDLPSDLPQVMADRRRVVQVLNNLLSNAARNAPESTEIRVSAVREDDHVSISVADEGRGLAPERVAHLFRKHAAPGDGGREGRASGHGLGLAICKGLVEAHGGRIRAESAGPGLGTTVVFTLPAADEAGGKARGASRRPSRQSGEGSGPARILVVDDDPRTLRLVRDALSSGGYAPVVTGDPGEIKRILRVERPALVVLDLALPGADGVELMTEIPELADLPVIFVSAYGRDETVARALDAGAADYVVKPFSPAELTARVRAALRRRERPAPFVLGELTIDYGSRQVMVAGREADLTATEYALLRVLSLNAGRVVPYETLLRQVWGGRKYASANLVRIFVRNLRRKLGDDATRPGWIFNQRGIGYRMPDPRER